MQTHSLLQTTSGALHSPAMILLLEKIGVVIQLTKNLNSKIKSDYT